MQISPKLAATTHALLSEWTSNPTLQRTAIDSFRGDIYSGLQVSGWSEQDRQYANRTLRILSGLYGILRPLDGIYPYRLEMGYKIPHSTQPNLYAFWQDSIANTLPESVPIINLSAVEYSKVLTPYINEARFITPRFLTISPKTNEPTFVVVHAKIARGAFANWLIKEGIDSVDALQNFTDLNYSYNQELSSANEPVFICNTFGGLGLSVRLKP